jgi:hypothetical protein
LAEVHHVRFRSHACPPSTIRPVEIGGLLRLRQAPDQDFGVGEGGLEL